MLICGAGIGGLTAALALVRAGCRVTILERETVIEEAGAGIQLAPNATRILDSLSVLRHLEGTVAPARVNIRRARDARVLQSLPLGEAASLRWGTPWLVAHRADLQNALLQAVALAGAAITLVTGAELTGFIDTEAYVNISFMRNGRAESIEADVLVGADGLNSRVRAQFQPSEIIGNTGRTAWRALIPADAAPAFAQRCETNLWLGKGAHLVHYPVRSGALINVVAIVAEGFRGVDEKGFWEIAGEASVLHRRYSRWSTDAIALIDAAPEWKRWPLFDRAPMPRIARGRVALLGDAAHPMLPFLAQGSAQAIEDAAVLGLAFEGMKRQRPSAGQAVGHALASYSHARTARTARVQLQSRRQGQIYHMSGALALARNLAMQFVSPQKFATRLDWLYGYRPTL